MAAAAPFKRILIGYLPTPQGADARALGVDLAAACGADLLLASVVSAVWIENIGEQTGPAVIHSGERDRASSALTEEAEKLAEAPGVGHFERRLEASRSPARGLHDLAAGEQADLVVVGSSHHGPVGRVLLGSVGERLLTGSPCAVAVSSRGYAERASRQLATIGVAFDGSPESRLALRTAHALAARTGASLQALMVVELPSTLAGQFVPLPGLEMQEVIERADAMQRQEQAARSILGDALHDLGAGVETAHEILVGADPAESILGLAVDADLLVMGSRGYGPVRRTLVGSVSHAVLRRAQCPVLITPRSES